MPESAPRHDDDAAPAAGAPLGWLTVAQAAEALGRSARSIQLMCKAGGLVARRVKLAGGRVWVIDPTCQPALALAAGIEMPLALASNPLAGLTRAKRNSVAAKLAAVRDYLTAVAHKPADMTLAKFQHHWVAGWNLRHDGGRPLARRTLMAWRRKLAAGGVTALIDNRRRHKKAVWTAEAREYFEGLYLQQALPHVPRLYEMMAAVAQTERWQIPSLRTVQKHVAERLDPKLAALGRDPKRFRDRCLPYAIRDWTTIPAMGCWVADHRQLDVLLPRRVWDDKKNSMVWKWFRPWLTMFMDARSWMPTAWMIDFDSPTGNRVMETFIRGVEAHGQPTALYLDNGKDFRMHRFAGGRKRPPRKGETIVAEKCVKPILTMLGVDSHFAIPYRARVKTIEVFFSILAERFDKTWRTYCGRRPDLRPEQLKGLAKKAGEFAANGYAIERLRAAFDGWVKDDYALRESPSRAADDPVTGRRLSALRAFKQLRPDGYRTQRPSTAALSILLMIPSKPVQVQANGVYVRPLGRHFWSDELEDRRCGSGRDLRRKIVYRYRADQPDRVFIFDATSDAFICVAGPYGGENVDPLAAPGTDDAERLAAAMALQGSLARRTADELRRRHSAANDQLAASRQGAGALGKLDRPATMPADPHPQIVFHPQLDAAAQAGQRREAAADRQKQQRLAEREFYANADTSTGTDDAVAAPAAPDPLDLLSQAERHPHPDETPHED